MKYNANCVAYCCPKLRQITDLFAKYGFELASVTLDVDKRTSLPAGSATVELAPGFDEADAIKSLKGQTCGGRPLKVMSNKPQVKKRMSSFGGQGGRYFLGGDDGVAELKCNSCGKAHKTMDCDADQVNPCHLCAARDHESGRSCLLSLPWKYTAAFTILNSSC